MTSSLANYRLLGRSGLRVSPLTLGTMTFGETWGADEAESRRIFDLYVDRGGNFIDTAGVYSHGASETLTAVCLEGKRDKLVLATKYSLAVDPGDPNTCGNGRKSMMRAVEDSLRRLRTDHIDLFYLHVWDGTTPADEILRGLDDLVRQGKIVYLGISDTPAWEVSRMQMMAELRGWSQFAALQAEYSLVQRTAERDLMPMARKTGIGVLPWSPLANGILSGKYATGADAGDEPGVSRRAAITAAGRVNPTSIAIADAVWRVAQNLGVSSAQVAIAWTLLNPAVCSTLLGARTLRQLEDNLGALDVSLGADDIQALDTASAIELGFPHDFLQFAFVRANLTGGTTIAARA